jgi:DNA relaxase NicK
MDFDYSGCWDDFYAFFVARANHYGLKMECQGDYVHGVNGRTLYIGSRTSAVRIRVYEKGIKQLSEGDLDASRDWVRVELQVRPKGKNKRLMWMFDSDAWLGSSKVMTEFVEVMHSWTPEKRPVGTLWKPRTSLEQRFDSMLRQYGPTLMEYIMIHHGGEFEALGRAVVERLEALEAFRRESA